jgi:hypothetical protein
MQPNALLAWQNFIIKKVGVTVSMPSLENFEQQEHQVSVIASLKILNIWKIIRQKRKVNWTQPRSVVRPSSAFAGPPGQVLHRATASVMRPRRRAQISCRQPARKPTAPESLRPRAPKIFHVLCHLAAPTRNAAVPAHDARAVLTAAARSRYSARA